MKNKDWEKICEEEHLFKDENEMMDAFDEEFDCMLTEYRSNISDKNWEKFRKMLLKTLDGFNHTQKECNDVVRNSLEHRCSSCGR